MEDKAKRTVVTYGQIKQFYTDEDARQDLKEQVEKACFERYEDFAWVCIVKGINPTKELWEEYKIDYENNNRN